MARDSIPDPRDQRSRAGTRPEHLDRNQEALASLPASTLRKLYHDLDEAGGAASEGLRRRLRDLLNGARPARARRLFTRVFEEFLIDDGRLLEAVPAVPFAFQRAHISALWHYLSERSLAFQQEIAGAQRALDQHCAHQLIDEALTFPDVVRTRRALSAAGAEHLEQELASPDRRAQLILDLEGYFRIALAKRGLGGLRIRFSPELAEDASRVLASDAVPPTGTDEREAGPSEFIQALSAIIRLNRMGRLGGFRGWEPAIGPTGRALHGRALAGHVSARLGAMSGILALNHAGALDVARQLEALAEDLDCLREPFQHAELNAAWMDAVRRQMSEVEPLLARHLEAGCTQLGRAAAFGRLVGIDDLLLLTSALFRAARSIESFGGSPLPEPAIGIFFESLHQTYGRLGSEGLSPDAVFARLVVIEQGLRLLGTSLTAWAEELAGPLLRALEWGLDSGASTTPIAQPLMDTFSAMARHQRPSTALS